MSGLSARWLTRLRARLELRRASRSPIVITSCHIGDLFYISSVLNVSFNGFGPNQPSDEPSAILQFTLISWRTSSLKLFRMALLPTSLLLAVANVLIPIAILTFASGFFPYKAVLPGLATYEPLDYGQPPAAPFDKVIFMVVDALRR